MRLFTIQSELTSSNGSSVKFKVLGFPLVLSARTNLLFHPKRNGFPPGLRDRSRGVNVTKPLTSRDA